MSSPIILLSSFSDEQRRKLTCLVEKLGGRVLQCVGYDQRCTHVVIGAILSTEKLLAGAIAGKWVVSAEYIESSFKARRWLEAERFILQTVGNGNERKLSEVPARWRNFRQQNGNQGPFRSWRVLLALADADKIRYKRLLQAGGAHVVIDKPPYVWSLKRSDKLTFVFTNKELFITVMSLHKKGIPCIHPDYVKDYIVQHHQLDINKYRANVYSHPVKKPVTGGYRKITSFLFTNPKSPETKAVNRRRGLSENVPNCTEKADGVKQRHINQCLPARVKPLAVSVPLDKVLLKRSCDPVIDLTTNTVSSSVDCIMSQPPSDCVTSQASTDYVMSQPPSDCVTSQASTDYVMSQPPSDCVTSQASTDCIMSQLPSDCVESQASTDGVTSQPPSDFVMSQLPTDHVIGSSTNCVAQPSADYVTELSSDNIVSQLPSDCVMSQVYSNDDTFQGHCTNIGQDSHDEVVAARLRFNSEPEHIKKHDRKRKRKYVSLAELPQQQEKVGQCCNHSNTVEETTLVSKVTTIDYLPVMNVMLHQRGLWTMRLLQQCDSNQVVRTSVETVVEGYLSDHQSVSRGLKCCHGLFTSHVPSAALLYQLTSSLMSHHMEDSLVTMVSMTLSKLLLLHPPHASVARQQHYKLFDLLGGSHSKYRKWEGLICGIINSRSQLLQYLTNVIILDYHRWLLLSSHAPADQPLLHKIMWDNRSCDTVSRPMKELSHHFTELLNSYHDDKYPYLESLCYLMFLIGHYMQSHSATPTVSTAPPHLQAAQLGCSVRVREHMMTRIKCCVDVDDYCNVLQQLIDL